MKHFLVSILSLTAAFTSKAQNLPHHWSLDELNHQIHIGDHVEEGIFNVDVIDTIYLQFANSNWYNTMTTNFNSGTELSATLTYNGEVYEQVGVSFKGQTSYSQVGNEEKKSFNIRMDSNISGQDLHGYDVLNLNNCFEDASFLREFMYLYLIRHEVPAASAAFVELVVNGESWGLYPMVQQLDGTYIKQWFLSNEGSRWRADAPAGQGGPGGPGGPNWGDGTAALNFLGTDETDYQQYYTLKGSALTDPWVDLVHTCDVLNNTSAAQLTTALPEVLDVDRTLWYLACENIFGDDDSYIFKGKMDYYLYWESETGRMVPLEFDGNSVLVSESANWGVFYHAENVNFPLLNKMLAIPEYRQRYLAHYRTIIQELVDPALTNGTIASFGDFIDAHVQADTKKLYSYNQFTGGVTSLHNSLQTRRNLVMTNAELNTTGAQISNVILHSQMGEWQQPLAGEEVTITSAISTGDGLDHVTLYYSNELVGNFLSVMMLDDGNSNDGAANDGVFGGQIPGMQLGAVVRFYIEAVEANTAHTATYMPVGAEHDVYYYGVTVAMASSTDIVINELMASNDMTSADEANEYEDWIELYNRGEGPVDLTNYYISDNSWNLTKWQLPDGTVLQPNEYLILWADEDSVDGMFHTNFKLSSDGESLSLLNSIGEIADQSIFGAQSSDQGYARNPNGIGEFTIQSPTFASNNDLANLVDYLNNASASVFPNPFSEAVHIRSDKKILNVELYNQFGAIVRQVKYTRQMEAQDLSQGLYFLKLEFEDGTKAEFKIVKN